VPGSGIVFISDPVWPCEMQLRKFVFASLSRQTLIEGQTRNDSSQIWWLEMSEDGDQILSAGRLTAPGSGSALSRSTVERMPSVAVSPSGRLTLAYLTRARRETSWRLCLAAFSLEEGTGRPVIASAAAPDEGGRNGLLPMPPTFSADGLAVFASARDGRIKKFSLAR
jgi:hypothetical protein